MARVFDRQVRTSLLPNQADFCSSFRFTEPAQTSKDIDLFYVVFLECTLLTRRKEKKAAKEVPCPLMGRSVTCLRDRQEQKSKP